MQPPPPIPPGGSGFGPPGSPTGPRGPVGWSSPPGPIGGYGLGLPPGVSVQAAYAPTGGGTEPMGIVSLVLGVVSIPAYFCCSVFALVFNIAGLVLGFVSYSRVSSQPERYSGKGIAIAALVVNGIFLLLNIALIVFVFGIMGLGMLSGP